MLLSKTSFSDDISELILNTRANTYASYNVSNDLLDGLRANTNLGSELVGNSNRSIRSNWVENARTYMSTTNNRAFMNRGGAGLPRYIEDTSSIGNIDKKIKELEETRNINARTVTNDFRDKNKNIFQGLVSDPPAISDPDYEIKMKRHKAVKSMFETNGLGPLYDDIEAYNNGSASKQSHLKSIMGDLAFHNQKIKDLPNNNLKNLSNASIEAVVKRNEIMDGAKTKLASLQVEKSNISTRKSNPIQGELDEVFFKNKNLNTVSHMSDLTKNEMELLLNHSDHRLRKDPTAALKMINENRAAQKNFILNVKDLSNDIVDPVSSASTVKVSNLKQTEIDRLSKKEVSRNSTKKYKEAVSERMHALKRQGVEQAWRLNSSESRLGLLDILNEGSIDPYNQKDLKRAIKGKNIKELLNKLPKGDLKVKKEFAKYILEYGDPQQVRSLRIYDNTSIHTIEADKSFAARCKRPY